MPSLRSFVERALPWPHLPVPRHLPKPRQPRLLVLRVRLEVGNHLPSTCRNQSSAASPSLRVTSSTVRLWRMPLRSSASWSNRLASVSLFAKRASKERPVRLAQDRILDLSQVGVLELAGQRLVVGQVERRVLLRSGLKPLVDLLQHVRGQAALHRRPRPRRCSAQSQLHLLDLRIELAQLWRQVEALLDQQILDRVLQRALALGKNASKSSGANGSRRRMSKAPERRNATPGSPAPSASPFASISSGRYSFGRRSLMTLRFVSAVSGVRFRIVSMMLPSRAPCPNSSERCGGRRDRRIAERAGHPVTRAAKHEQVEDAVVDRGAPLGLACAGRGSGSARETRRSAPARPRRRRTRPSRRESRARSWTRPIPSSDW